MVIQFIAAKNGDLLVFVSDDSIKICGNKLRKNKEID
jgi:hypothetical protein